MTKEEYLSFMGNYPVICLSLKSGKRPTFEGACRQLGWEIAMEFQRHCYLLDGDMTDGDRKIFLQVLNQEADEETICGAVRFLSHCLERYFGRKTVILIDEYDVPLENAFSGHFYEEMAGFIRSMFEAALKTNNSLEFAVITGCLRISKESNVSANAETSEKRSKRFSQTSPKGDVLFTGLNNFKIHSILDEKYSEYFGFTEKEVQKICGDYHVSHKYNLFREWYNGYVFGNTNVYNPWSVVQFMDDLQDNENSFPKSYWANTSSNQIVRSLIELADDNVRSEIEDLINGSAIEKPIHEDITYDEVYERMDNLWNFMFFTGYFKKVGERIGENDMRYLTFEIPNREVRYIFHEKIMSWFDKRVKEKDLTKLYAAFLEKDANALETELSEILCETISSFDESENYYHGIVAGLLSGMKGYRIKSNRESGKGRCDLFVKPISRKKEAFIIEFKVAKKLKNLAAKAEDAVKQIEEKRYVLDLRMTDMKCIVFMGLHFAARTALSNGNL